MSIFNKQDDKLSDKQLCIIFNLLHTNWSACDAASVQFPFELDIKFKN